MVDPKPGDLWRYDYLWHWQAAQGESEGRKARPITFVSVVRDADSKTHLFILPLTTKAPDPDRLAILIPSPERRRAGLTGHSQVWLLLDEYNHDLFEQSYVFDPKERIGSFSSRFHALVLQAFKKALMAKASKRISRYP